MSEVEKVNGLADRYSRNPLLRGLIQLIPFGIGSGIDVALVTHIENIRAERVRIFFDELQNGNRELSPELLESEDFLHCYFSTTKAALNSRRTEKIRIFAKLLKSSFDGTNTVNIDEYEEFLSILDDLSFREILILLKLYSFEIEYPKQGEENDLQRASRFWDKFVEELNTELGVRVDEVDSIMTRLNRTGCYETFIGGYFDYTGGKGKLTPTFFRMKDLILEL
jgi:hypothetical protein